MPKPPIISWEAFCTLNKVFLLKDGDAYLEDTDLPLKDIKAQLEGINLPLKEH